MICRTITLTYCMYYVTIIIRHSLFVKRSELYMKLKYFYILRSYGNALSQLVQGTGNLNYSSYCIWRMSSACVERSFLVRGGNILFRNFVTYLLDGNINENHYMYLHIKSSDILQCQPSSEHDRRSGIKLRKMPGKKRPR